MFALSMMGLSSRLSLLGKSYSPPVRYNRLRSSSYQVLGVQKCSQPLEFA